MAAFAGLALSLALAAGSLDASAIAYQYERLVRCKTLHDLASNTGDKRSARAAAKIDAKLGGLPHGKSQDQLNVDMAVQRARLQGEEARSIESSWRACLSEWDPREGKIDKAFMNRLSERAPQADRLAAARAVAVAPENYGALLLLMASEPLMLKGQTDDARFLFYAGDLRTSHYLSFLDTQADQNTIQVYAITRRYVGTRFFVDSMRHVHDTRVAVERVVAWDRAKPNPDLAEVLNDEPELNAALAKIEARRCNYLAYYYFEEAATTREIRERYNGDAAKFSKQIEVELARMWNPADDLDEAVRIQKEGAFARLTARQKDIVASAETSVAKVYFGGDATAMAEHRKADPIGVCALLLAEAKKLVQ